jgi:hypothetical protein
MSDLPVVDMATLSQIFELDTGAPNPYGYSSELIGTLFRSARETVASMTVDRYVVNLHSQC